MEINVQKDSQQNSNPHTKLEQIQQTSVNPDPTMNASEVTTAAASDIYDDTTEVPQVVKDLRNMLDHPVESLFDESVPPSEYRTIFYFASHAGLPYISSMT